MTSSHVADFDPALVRSWVDKAQGRINGVIGDAVLRAGGRLSAVGTELVSDAAQAPYGRFMVAWPEDLDPDGNPVILHLADGAFFLSLLELSYADALTAEPDLCEALRDGSRLEIAITNDVLQVQAAGPSGRYSMIRHHALMHWAATAWLDGRASERWFRLYDVLACLCEVDDNLPTADQLDGVEDQAFAAFERMATGTHGIVDARSVLADEASLHPVMTYLRYAAVAIAVLQRSYRASGMSAEEFLAEQITVGYREPAFLRKEWNGLLG